jgi:hypothetical protein
MQQAHVPTLAEGLERLDGLLRRSPSSPQQAAHHANGQRIRRKERDVGLIARIAPVRIPLLRNAEIPPGIPAGQQVAELAGRGPERRRPFRVADHEHGGIRGGQHREARGGDDGPDVAQAGIVPDAAENAHDTIQPRRPAVHGVPRHEQRGQHASQLPR